MKRKYVFLLVSSLIVLGVAMRLMVPETWYNFSPMGAIVLFAAAYFSKKPMAFVVPAIIWFVGDMVINNTSAAAYFQNGFTLAAPYQLFNLLFMVAVVLMGRRFLHGKINAISFLGTSLGAAVLFFLITNFGSWLGMAQYPKTLEGLVSAYIAGIPFFRNTLASQLLFGGVLFGLYEGIKHIVIRETQAKVS